MRVVIQRVKEAAVSVGGKQIAKIGKGLLVLLGIGKEDKEEQIKELSAKVINLRIFEDEQGKMNLSLQDIGGEILVVPQFTLYANTAKGRRPSFEQAAPPEIANSFFEQFARALQEQGIKVQKGAFGQHMQVNLVNDGPVTIMMEE